MKYGELQNKKKHQCKLGNQYTKCSPFVEHRDKIQLDIKNELGKK